MSKIKKTENLEDIVNNGWAIKNYPLSIIEISPILSPWLKYFFESKDNVWNSLQNHIWLKPNTVLDMFEKRGKVTTYNKKL
jgi:hypothetical protein